MQVTDLQALLLAREWSLGVAGGSETHKSI